MNATLLPLAWFDEDLAEPVRPLVLYSLTATAGSYTWTGTAASLSRKVDANAGAFALSGTAATLRRTALLLAPSYGYKIVAEVVSPSLSFVNNFAVLLHLSNAGLKSVANGGHINNIAADGFRPADFAVYASNGTTLLPFDVTAWDRTTGEIWVDVMVPQITTGMQLVVKYGDVGTTVYQGNQVAVWATSSLKDVWHLVNRNGALNLVSSKRGETLINTGVTLGTDRGGTAVFNGASGMSLSAGATFTLDTNITIVCVVKVGALSRGELVSRYFLTSSAGQFKLNIGEIGSGIPAFYASDGANTFSTTNPGTGGVNVGTWYCLAGVQFSTFLNLTRNGVSYNTGNVGFGTLNASMGSVATMIGNNQGNAGPLTGEINEVRIYDAALSDPWMTAEGKNLADPDAFWSVGAEAVNVTYSFTGTAATFPYSRRVTSDTGAYLWTGIAATLTKASATGITLAADAGAYAWTGTTSTLHAARRLSSDAGSYAWTGLAATFPQARRLTSGIGSYTQTGTTATLRATRYLSSNAGNYAWAGTATTFRHSRRVTSNTGAYLWTGIDANLRWVRPDIAFGVDAGAFAWSGIQAALRWNHVVPANTGVYTWAGIAVNFPRTRVAVADTGAFAWAGDSIDLFAARYLETEVGVYTWTGAPIGRVQTFTLVAEAGAYVWTAGPHLVLWSADPRIIRLAGAYQPNIFNTGNYVTSLDMQGSAVTRQSLEGQYVSQINLAGTSVPVVEFDGSLGAEE